MSTAAVDRLGIAIACSIAASMRIAATLSANAAAGGAASDTGLPLPIAQSVLPSLFLSEIGLPDPGIPAQFVRRAGKDDSPCLQHVGVV
jgi:hypothetical protein